MIPHDKTKAQINPRKLILEGSELHLYDLICRAGYVPEDQNFSDFCQSLKSGRAWLVSGTRGSGKTAFPEALAAACNLTICIVAGRDGSPVDASLVPELAQAVAGRVASSAEALRSTPAGRVFHLRQPLFPHSASEVRARIAAGLPWDGLVPAPVAAWIRARRLYGAAPADAAGP